MSTVKLWVLEWTSPDGKVTVYLAPNMRTAKEKQHAQKFRSASSASEFLKSRSTLWPYEPKEYEFDENDDEKKGRCG